MQTPAALVSRAKLRGCAVQAQPPSERRLCAVAGNTIHLRFVAVRSVYLVESIRSKFEYERYLRATPSFYQLTVIHL